MTTPIGIICIDDNAEVCAAIRSYVRDRAEYRWLGELDRGDGALELVRSTNPNVVVLDVDMPGRPAALVMEDLASSGTGVRVIVFSGYCRREMIERALDAGAWGYVSKNDGEAALFDAITRAMAGEVVLSPEASAALR